MVDYSTVNLQWLTEKYSLSKKFTIELGDAMNHAWTGDIDAVVAETYLGQPFSAPPSPTKLTEVRGNCNHIISTFLSNIHQQLQPGTTLCLAVPAWRDTAGRFTHLPLINNLERLGYSSASLTTVRPEQLLYYREDQVVARQLLVLTRQ